MFVRCHAVLEFFSSDGEVAECVFEVDQVDLKVVHISCSMCTTSVSLGNTIRSSVLDLAFPWLRLMSKMILLLMLPSSFCFKMNAIFETVPVSPRKLLTQAGSSQTRSSGEI